MYLILVCRILLKKKELRREGGITGLLYMTIMEGCIMEGYYSIKPFGFAMAVLGSTIRPTTVHNWVVTALQCILTPSFITVDMFALVVSYFFMFASLVMMITY